jgi:hypothetical protein
LGYGLVNPTARTLYGNRFDGRRIAFWGGSGGSSVINDLDARMSVTYAMSRHVEHGMTDQQHRHHVRCVRLACALTETRDKTLFLCGFACTTLHRRRA